MGKHSSLDKKANLTAASLLREKKFEDAAALLATTSKKNQQDFIKRVKNTPRKRG